MVKGAVSLVVILLVIWFFWMSFEWLRNRNIRRNNRKKR